MGKFRLTDDALEDLREMKAWSLQHFGKLQTASWLQSLRDTMQTLADHPRIGREEATLLWPDVFSHPCMSHTIYYIPSPGGIDVIGIIHQSRMPALLLKRKS